MPTEPSSDRDPLVLPANSVAESEPTATSPERFDCLVISDLHLGSEVAQVELLAQFLTWAIDQTDELVLNGDLFDDLNFTRLDPRHLACLKLLRTCDQRADLKLIWIRGNHDGPAWQLSQILGVDVLDEYVYHDPQTDTQILIIHGDQYDHITSNHALLTSFACGIYYYIQKWMPHGISRWIRRVSKKFQRNSQIVEGKAVAEARSRGIPIVTCGHTHMSLASERDGIRYLNTGTWTEHPPCPFLAIKGGRVWLESWPLVTDLATSSAPSSSASGSDRAREANRLTPAQPQPA